MKKLLFILLFISTIISAQDYNWARLYNIADSINGLVNGRLDSIKIGDGSFTVDNSAILVNRNLTAPLGTYGGHGIRDESTWNTTSVSGLMGYSSFDAIVNLTGNVALAHLAGYQFRPIYNTAGTITTIRGFTFYPTYNTGTVSQSLGIDIADALGSGTVTQQIGLYVQPLTRGTSSNYAIYTGGTTPSYFGGLLQTSGNMTAAGVVSGSNLQYSFASRNLSLGSSTLASSYNTYLGAGQGSPTGSGNTLVGASAGAALVSTQAGNVFIGAKSGFYETGSNKLFIDNQLRTNEATSRTNSLIYGVFDATPANQSLAVNGTLKAIAFDFSSITTDSTTVSAGYIYVTPSGIVRVKQ